MDVSKQQKSCPIFGQGLASRRTQADCSSCIPGRMSIPMDSVGAAEVRCAPPPRIEYILTARALRFTRALLWQALKKALANGPAAPGAYDNKGGFDSYAQHAQVDYAEEVKGVVVGYGGHVPRARDTVGTCPLGKVPGTPVSPTGKVGIDMEKMMNGEFVRVLQPPDTDFKQLYRQTGDLAQYTSEARDPQNTSNKMAPQMHGQGTTPGYTGHVPRVKTHSLGATTHSMPQPDPSRASKNDGWRGAAHASLKLSRPSYLPRRPALSSLLLPCS